MSLVSAWFKEQTEMELAAEVKKKNDRREKLRLIGTTARARIQRMPYILALYCQLKCEDLRG